MAVLTHENLIKSFIFGAIIVMRINNVDGATTNLTCYQCETHDNEECDLKDLKPCPSSFDRCAVHINKDAGKRSTVISRKCGLAPCGFDDEMMARGLGMDCDRSKDSYSCVFCCKENGCNKNSANSKIKPSLLIIFGLLVFCLLNVARDFIPPFVMAENIKFKK